MAEKEPKYYNRRAAQQPGAESHEADGQNPERKSPENVAETSLIDVSVTTPSNPSRNVAGNMQSPTNVNMEE